MELQTVILKRADREMFSVVKGEVEQVLSFRLTSIQNQ